jgi:hypothetical protein
MALNRRQRLSERVYAVVRVDLVDDGTVPWPVRVTVKSIERSDTIAEQEVRRLNAVNAGKNCVYFWQQTRLAVPLEKRLNSS